MSQILNRSVLVSVPQIEMLNTTVSTTLDATGEICHMVGYITLDDPLASAKTISAAGGGSIVWKSGTITFANAGSTFEVGIQDISTSTAPAQGDGTFDVKASFTGGGGGITTAAVNTSVMTSGTKSVSNSQLLSVTFSMTARAGSDSVVISSAGKYAPPSTGIPCVTDNTTGTIALVSSAEPLCYIIFDDGTIGWFYACPFIQTVSSVAFNSGSAIADEYVNLINTNFTFKASGVWFYGNIASASSDFEVILYSDALGTPVAERTIVVDSTRLGVVATGRAYRMNFSSAYVLQPNSNYAISIRPTTANNITLLYFDTNTLGKKTGIASDYCYAARRLDNASAFSDYNNGTAKTRLMSISLLGNYIEQGVNNANYRIGI